VGKRSESFSSFKEALKADAQVYMSMTSEERIQNVIEFRDRRHSDAAKQRLALVCRMIKRENPE
jgi:hypothetical protein